MKSESSEHKDIMLRLATPNDLGFIQQLAEDVFSAFGDYGQILRQFFYSPDVTTFIGESDGRPVALAMAERAWDRRTKLYYIDLLAIAVTPSQQAHGLGSRMLAALFEWALQKGASSMWLSVADTNSRAQQFFMRHGFSLVVENDGYYPAGQIALRMSKELVRPRGKEPRG